MKNRNYIYFGLVACLALLFFAQTNSYAVVNNLAAKGIAYDGKDNDGPTFEKKLIDLDADEAPVDLADKGKRFYGTSPRGKDISIFTLWFGKLHDLWYKVVLQDN